MNQREITSPMKIVLEIHNNVLTWEGPWDCNFTTLFDAFAGLCSAAGFADKSELKQCVCNDVHEDILSQQEYEDRKKYFPKLFEK